MFVAIGVPFRPTGGARSSPSSRPARAQPKPCRPEGRGCGVASFCRPGTPKPPLRDAFLGTPEKSGPAGLLELCLPRRSSSCWPIPRIYIHILDHSDHVLLANIVSPNRNRVNPPYSSYETVL